MLHRFKPLLLSGLPAIARDGSRTSVLIRPCAHAPSARRLRISVPPEAGAMMMRKRIAGLAANPRKPAAFNKLDGLTTRLLRSANDKTPYLSAQ